MLRGCVRVLPCLPGIATPANSRFVRLAGVSADKKILPPLGSRVRAWIDPGVEWPTFAGRTASVLRLPRVGRGGSVGTA
jgi:hypothetical protein